MLRKSVRKTAALSWLKRLLSGGQQLSLPPSVLQQLTDAEYVQVQKLPNQGRGLAAAKNIAYGEVLFTEEPFVCCPAISNRKKVCYHCLKVLPSLLGPATTSQPAAVRTRSHSFCSTDCLSAAQNSYYSLEAQLPRLQQLDQYCSAHGERFPLMAARLALMIAQGSMGADQAAADGGDMSRMSISSKSSSIGRISRGLASSSWRSSSSYKRGEVSLSRASTSAASGISLGTSGELERQIHTQQLMWIVRRNGVSSSAQHVDAALGFLCFANVPPPLPSPWVEAHQLLWGALAAGLDMREHQEEANRLQEVLEHLNTDWYCAVLARLHLNTFKVDGVMEMDWDSGHAAAAAMLQADSSTGSALYLLGSLFNHSCEPNVNVSFPRSNSTVVFTAVRPIAAGEQLLISYIDPEQEVDRRQEYLAFAYGFKCQCQRCVEELAEAAKHMPPQLH